MTAFDQDIFIKMLLSVSQKDDAALFPKSEHSPYNMESVDDLANVRPTGQIIMAKCVSGAALQVKPVRPIVFAEQRAA